MDIAVDGNKIRELRLTKSWSQEQLADASGLHHRTIQRIETENRASPKSRQALANALAIFPTDLDLEHSTNTQDSTNQDSTLPIKRQPSWFSRIFLLAGLTVFVATIAFIYTLLATTKPMIGEGFTYIDDKPSFWEQLIVATYPFIFMSFIGFLIFPIPTILAWRRHHHFKWPITMINLVGTLFFSFGGGIIGFTSAWLVAFSWCFFETKPQQTPISFD